MVLNEGYTYFKFGKAPAKEDARNLMFAAILKAPASVPPEYDFDVQHQGVPTPMFGNDQFRDCVMAGRAHQTLRFELIEQNVIIPITEKEVEREYFKETDGQDSGLFVLDSLKEWRKRGWIAAKRRYKIRAFSQIQKNNHDEVKQAVFMDVGAGLGLSLPDEAMSQFWAGKPWDVAGEPNPYMGHYVYVPGYTTQGPVCVTWGRKQQMTWAFFDKYCDEAYTIIDAVDTPKKKSALDEPKIEAFLAAL
jgi:hypothetical protein